MRRVFVLSSPFVAVAAGLLLFHAATRAVAERPAAEKKIAKLAGLDAYAQIPPPPMRVEGKELPDSAPGYETSKPPAPEPPAPFDEQASWLPLEEATPAQNTCETNAPAAPMAPTSPSPEAMELGAGESATVEEILRIRKMLEFNPFKGTVIEEGLPSHIVELGRGAAPLPSNCPSGDDEFVAALKKVTLDERAAAGEETAESPAPLQFDPYAGDSSVSSDFAPHERPTAQPEEMLTETSEVELVAALRTACRALEQRANHHEDLGEFERSDDLRALAGELRRESRRK